MTDEDAGYERVTGHGLGLVTQLKGGYFDGDRKIMEPCLSGMELILVDGKPIDRRGVHLDPVGVSCSCAAARLAGTESLWLSVPPNKLPWNHQSG